MFSWGIIKTWLRKQWGLWRDLSTWHVSPYTIIEATWLLRQMLILVLLVPRVFQIWKLTVWSLPCDIMVNIPLCIYFHLKIVFADYCQLYCCKCGWYISLVCHCLCHINIRVNVSQKKIPNSEKAKQNRRFLTKESVHMNFYVKLWSHFRFISKTTML